MKQLFYYLIQVIAASGLLYSYYHLALRNKKFHRYNRFYLLASIVISLLIPLLNIPVYFTTNESDSSLVIQTLYVLSSPAITVTGTEKSFANLFTFSNLIYLSYIIIASIVLIRVLFSISHLLKIAKNSPIQKLGNIKFVSTDEQGTPFSFFRWLFWNNKIELQSEKGEQIFRHELFHIQQKHSWDILFLELLTVVFWINPFFYFIKKEIKAIHEFLADEFAINKKEKWQYAELLLMQALNTKTKLVNPFFHTLIKRRINMITSSQKPSYLYLRKLMVLPVTAIVIFLFAFTYKEKKDASVLSVFTSKTKRQTFQDTTAPKNDSIIRLKGNIIITDTSKPGGIKPLIVIDGKIFPQLEINNLDTKISPSEIESINVLKNKSAIDKYGDKGKNGVIEIYTKKNVTQNKVSEVWNTAILENKSDEEKVFEKLEEPPSFPGGNREWRRFLERNLDANLPIQNGLKSGTFTIIIQFIVDKEGNPINLVPLTKNGFGMEEHVMDLINKGPRWIPGKQNGVVVNSYQKQPVTFVIGDGKPDHSIDVSKNEEDVKYLNEIVVTGLNQDATKIFDKVDQEPSFPGGQTEWRNFVIKNLKASVPVDSGAKAGSYTAVIQFIVHTDGHLSDIKALTNHGFGIEKECLRLMALSPKWNPAKQNDEKVVAYKKQPITFVISEQ